MLFDCAALAIGLYASYVSKLNANSEFTYGCGTQQRGEGSRSHV